MDTNVVVSALLWGGVPYRLLQAATAGNIKLYTSSALLAELREVLGRAHLAPRLERQRSSVDQAIGLYGELAVSVSPLTTPRVVLNDADDDHVIACAVAAHADIIVSGDRDLLSLGSHQSIAVLTAAQAVEKIGSA